MALTPEQIKAQGGGTFNLLDLLTNPRQVGRGIVESTNPKNYEPGTSFQDWFLRKTAPALNSEVGMTLRDLLRLNPSQAVAPIVPTEAPQQDAAAKVIEALTAVTKQPTSAASVNPLSMGDVISKNLSGIRPQDLDKLLTDATQSMTMGGRTVKLSDVTKPTAATKDTSQDKWDAKTLENKMREVEAKIASDGYNADIAKSIRTQLADSWVNNRGAKSDEVMLWAENGLAGLATARAAAASKASDFNRSREAMKQSDVASIIMKAVVEGKVPDAWGWTSQEDDLKAFADKIKQASDVSYKGSNTQGGIDPAALMAVLQQFQASQKK